jgi:hypothetical protein
MAKFDLKKAILENKATFHSLLKEDKGLTPFQQEIYDFEEEISGEDFAAEEIDNIRDLNNIDDVENYYANYRGWEDDNSLNGILRDLIRGLAKQFPDLAEAKDINEEKSNTKMKKSEFKDKIKEMVLSEMEKDVDYTDETSGYDFLAEVDAILAEAEKEEEETDTETADAEVETPEGTEDVEVTDTTTTATVDPNVKAVQDALTQAQAAAQTLGDAKLTDQIGNTITFFTRSHVVDKGAVAEGEEKELEEGVWSFLPDRVPEFVKAVEELKDEYHGVVGDDDIFDHLDGAIRRAEELRTAYDNKPERTKFTIPANENKMEEGKKEYYKGAEADDAEHIKALEKDMEDDKKSSMKIKEVVFPMWTKLNK